MSSVREPPFMNLQAIASSVGELIAQYSERPQIAVVLKVDSNL